MVRPARDRERAPVGRGRSRNSRDPADVRRAIGVTLGKAAIPGFSPGEGPGSPCELTVGIAPESARRGSRHRAGDVSRRAMAPGPVCGRGVGLRGVYRAGEQPACDFEQVFTNAQTGESHQVSGVLEVLSRPLG